MVRAILDGRKTQTRRVLKPQPFVDDCGNFYAPDRKGMVLNWGQNIDRTPCTRNFIERAAPYALGSILYVRETMGVGYWPNRLWYGADEAVRYGDDGAFDFARHYPRISVPSIHMPRWASRLTLEVTDVRVQRLQEISEEDAKAEGIERVDYAGTNPKFKGSFGWKDYRDHPHAIVPFADDCARASFETLWDSINAKREGGRFSWDANPWVAAVTFKPHQQNVDDFLKGRAA
jgi:hypothetical protein